MSIAKNTLFATAIFGLLPLSGCGGGSSLSLTGKVIDGYIGGATVCLDVNNNYECDSDDPTTESQADGSYALDYSGSLEGLHVLAEVDEGATDEDLKVCPDNHVKHSYMLIAPAKRSSVITPMTTLVSTEMLKTGKSIDDASQDVQEFLSQSYDLSIDPLDYDFKESEDDDAAEVAKKYVAAMAVMNNTIDNSVYVTNMAFTHGEKMMGALLKAKENLLPILAADPVMDSCSDPLKYIQDITDDDELANALPDGIDDAEELEDEVKGLTNVATG